MEQTLLDTIKSENWVRDENGKIKYQSLPPAVKELSCDRRWLFLKDWYFVFEVALDLRKLEAICKKNKLRCNFTA